MKLFVFLFVGISGAALGAKATNFVTCQVHLIKDRDPKADCEKKEFTSRKRDVQLAAEHDKAFNKMKSSLKDFKCFRENEKDRIQKQTFTVCHNKKKTVYHVFMTSEPVDTRSIIYFRGLQMRWFENDAGVFLYKRYLMPKASWKQWLLP